VVEDEPLISLDITERLQDVGARVVSAAHLEKALGLAEWPDLAAGVLDFDLGKADSTPVCWKLAERRIPSSFIVAGSTARSGNGPVHLWS
jgi:DNA-binding response OmpR family regulator